MEEIEVIEKEIGDVIEIEERVSMLKMPSVMGKDFTLILEYLKTKDVRCKEAPYARYLDIDWEVEMKKGMFANIISAFTKKWHFQIGMPTEKKIGGTDNMISKHIKTEKYIKTHHYGPYQKVGGTYKKMCAWAKTKNLTLDKESFEFYLNDPGETKKEDLKTMVLIPVINK